MTEKDALAIASTFTTPTSTRICYFLKGRHLRRIPSFHTCTLDSQTHNTKRAAYLDFNCQYIVDSLPYFSHILLDWNMIYNALYLLMMIFISLSTTKRITGSMAMLLGRRNEVSWSNADIAWMTSRKVSCGVGYSSARFIISVKHAVVMVL